MARLVNILILLFVFSISYSQTNTGDIESIESRNNKNISKLIVIVKYDSHNIDGISLDKESLVLLDEIKKLNRSSNYLFSKLKQENSLGEEYFHSLVHSQQALEELIGNWKSNMYAIQLLKSITVDYQVKINAANMGLTSNSVPSIKVKVVTKDLSGNYIGGFDVKANYIWDYNESEAKFLFNNQTNQAVKPFTPGYYVIWIEKNGVLVGKRKVEIGDIVKPEQTILFNI